MGKYVISKTPTGQKFTLTTQNGASIAESEVYDTRKACLAGIDSIRKNAPHAALEDQTVQGFLSQKHPKFQLYRDRAGRFRFRLKAGNGRIIAVSGIYQSHSGCLNGIQSLRNNADSEISEQDSQVL